MDPKRFEELTARYVTDDQLAPDEERALAEAVAAQPERQAELLEDVRTEGALLALGREARDAEIFAQQFQKRVAAETDAGSFVARVQARLQQPPPRRRWPLLAGFAAVAAVAVLIAVPIDRRLRESPPAEPAVGGGHTAQSPAPTTTTAPSSLPLPRLAGLRGDTFVLKEGRREAAAGGAPLEGSRGVLTVGRQSRAEVIFPDGSRLEIGGDSAVPQVQAVDRQGKGAMIARGWMRATIARQPADKPFVITTPHTEITVVGTRLLVEVDDTGTRIDVSEGAVRLARHTGDSRAEVRAGQYGLAQQGQEVAVLAKPRGTVLFVVGSMVLSNADALVAERLRGMGFDVQIQGAGRPREADLQRASLVVLSSTLTSDDVNIHYGNQQIPILTWEAWLYDDLGLTRSASENGEADSTRHGPHYAELIIKHRGHPLAAGMDGAIPVSRTPMRMTYGKPGPAADWIATLPGDPTRAVIFAYEKGAMLATMEPAPARRVGFFLWDKSAPRINDAGWKLFEAAVLWCANAP